MNSSFSRLALAASLAVNASMTLADDTIVVTELATGLNHPWGMVFLPDQSLLLTERSGNIRHFHKGQLSAPLSGVPEVVASYQGGMLDITIDPDFTTNKALYF
jgi:glucose/arabinose dehydrogenase